ncbi:MAG: nickel pincer cofactor biosynthesis protein LarB [Firmicutes bacterium]|nr:nickel pincer cofactor biosynthesis protein LarB [Bacillota bacterium]
MFEEELRVLLKKFKHEQLSLEETLQKFKKLPFEDLKFAKIDHHRPLRQGFPEVIFCQGKTPEQVVNIFQALARGGHNVLATRACHEIFAALQPLYPRASYHAEARLVSLITREIKKTAGQVLVVSAGTADIPVAEEAAVTAEILGHNVDRVYDVGVAGIHRLFAHYEKLQTATVIIVAAGMEGALPSVVSGLVAVPVIAVPTSIGYGAHFGGLSALLAMLNSCAGGIGVVNIDNGFGAATLAHAIVQSGLKP